MAAENYGESSLDWSIDRETECLIRKGYDRQLRLPENSAINQIADRDVEMQPVARESDLGTYIIVDTNILLHQYEVLRTFIDDVEKSRLPVVVVVPGAVIYELDGLKNKGNLWPARRASGWLLEKVKEHKAVKVQATEETCKLSRNWRSRTEAIDLAIPDGMMNDHLIVDCCQYFYSKNPRTIMCSADNNLCLMAHGQGLPTISPPYNKIWTSRDIAIVLYGPSFHCLEGFGTENKAFKHGDTQSAAGARAIDSSDLMMVDDESVVEEAPLNVLHDDVRVYFTRLLVEASARIGGADLAKACDLSLSRYAAGWRKIHYSAWTATECLEYLSHQRPEIEGVVKTGHPRLEAFLGLRYATQGARTGREWSPQDWRSALEKLGNIGCCLGKDDPGLVAAVEDLTPYLDILLPLNLK